MKFVELKINGQFLIAPKLFKDERGIFRRSYCTRILKKEGINFKAKQGNISENPLKGTLRGFHYQNDRRDSKILTCVTGKFLNVTVDLRKKSSTFLQITKNILSAKNKKSILVPGGCANLFITLKNNTIIHYYMNNIYNSKKDKGLKYNDPLIKIKWPIKPKIISSKDKKFKNLKI